MSTTAVAPSRSYVQRMEALKRANTVRTKRSKLKKDLKAGNKSIHILLRKPPPYIETMKLSDLLIAVPKYGRIKVNKILAQARISPSKTVGGLSDRQRREVIQLIN